MSDPPYDMSTIYDVFTVAGLEAILKTHWDELTAPDLISDLASECLRLREKLEGRKLEGVARICDEFGNEFVGVVALHRERLEDLVVAARYALDHIRKLESGAYNDPQFPMPRDVKDRLEKALAEFEEKP